MTILLILVVHRALRVQPFGAMHAGRISVVGSRSLASSDQLGPLPYRTIAALRDASFFSDVEGARDFRLRIDLPDTDGYRVSAMASTRGLLDVLGVSPVLGRTFTRAANGGFECLVSNWLWRARFRSDPNVLNQPLSTSEGVCYVVGVLPGAVDGWPASPGVWMPVDHVNSLRDELRTAGIHRFTVFVSSTKPLPPAAALTAAVNEDVSVIPTSFGDYMLGRRQLGILACLNVLGLTLVATCLLNIALLCYATLQGSRTQLGVQLALGASPLRLVLQQQTAVVVLAVCASAVAFGLTSLATHTALRLQLAPAYLSAPRWSDFVVAAFGTLVAVTVPAAGGALHRLRRRDIATLLVPTRTVTSGVSTSAQCLFGAQVIAATATVVIGLGFIGTLQRVVATELGFKYDDVLIFNAADTHGTNFGELQTRLTQSHAVQEAGLTTDVPIIRLGTGPLDVQGSSMSLPGGRYVSNGDPRTAHLAPGVRYVTSGFFRVLDVQLLAGRPFDEQMTPGTQRVAIVSRAFERTFWGGESAVGKQLSLARRRGGIVPDDSWLTVVGVVSDVRFDGPSSQPRPEVYLPLTQHPRPSFMIAMRPQPEKWPDAIAHLRDVSGHAGVRTVGFQTTLRDAYVSVTASDRYVSAAGTASLLLALLLAAVSITATVRRHLLESRRSIVIRLALGASIATATRPVERVWTRVMVIATGLGLAAAAVVVRVLQSLAAPTEQVSWSLHLLAGVAMMGVFVVTSRVLAARLRDDREFSLSELITGTDV